MNKGPQSPLLILNIPQGSGREATGGTQAETGIRLDAGTSWPRPNRAVVKIIGGIVQQRCRRADKDMSAGRVFNI